MPSNITTYAELNRCKKELKNEIAEIEKSIKENKYLKFSSTVFEGKSLKEPLLESLSSLNLKNILVSPLGSIVSSFLLSNKFVRKYFIAFSIVKETFPYALLKIKEIIEQLDPKNQTATNKE